MQRRLLRGSSTCLAGLRIQVNKLPLLPRGVLGEQAHVPCDAKWVVHLLVGEHGRQ